MEGNKALVGIKANLVELFAKLARRKIILKVINKIAESRSNRRFCRTKHPLEHKIL